MEARKLGELEIEMLPPGRPARVLTVDVEDWYHSNFRSAPELDPRTLPRRVEAGVDRVLEVLARAAAKATFFVLGIVAREHPRIVPRIAAAGHEIGCHGMHHTLVYRQSPAEFEREAAEARELLRDQSGQPVPGFRAPSWSLTRESLWAFERLTEIGFRYDSSVFPARNYLYGIGGAPTAPYRVRMASGRTVLEIPPPVLALGPLRLGAGGGFYLRALPLWAQRLAARSYARRGSPFLAYVHPRELDPGAWDLRLPLSRLEQGVHRFGIRSVPRKLEKLLRTGSWRSIAATLDELGALHP
jgi:polysaccharide deacetylase family protein (PEP-CTERM system associated)